MCVHVNVQTTGVCWTNNKQKQDCLANKQMTDNKNSFESTVESRVKNDT